MNEWLGVPLQAQNLAYSGVRNRCHAPTGSLPTFSRPATLGSKTARDRPPRKRRSKPENTAAADRWVIDHAANARTRRSSRNEGRFGYCSTNAQVRRGTFHAAGSGTKTAGQFFLVYQGTRQAAADVPGVSWPPVGTEAGLTVSGGNEVAAAGRSETATGTIGKAQRRTVTIENGPLWIRPRIDLRFGRFPQLGGGWGIQWSPDNGRLRVDLHRVRASRLVGLASRRTGVRFRTRLHRRNL